VRSILGVAGMLIVGVVAGCITDLPLDPHAGSAVAGKVVSVQAAGDELEVVIQNLSHHIEDEPAEIVVRIPASTPIFRENSAGKVERATRGAIVPDRVITVWHLAEGFGGGITSVTAVQVLVY
jgi:hypothetical protein